MAQRKDQSGTKKIKNPFPDSPTYYFPHYGGLIGGFPFVKEVLKNERVFKFDFKIPGGFEVLTIELLYSKSGNGSLFNNNWEQYNLKIFI